MMKKKKTISQKKKDFFDKVYEIVAEIPYGKVATYGDIAEACGIRSSARTVGWALNGAKESGLPCHRVVNRFGALTGKMHFGSYDLMEELLKSEGITFDKDGCVMLDKHLWKPLMGVKSPSSSSSSVSVKREKSKRKI
jgi:methylated-DNA-protein-cysteine methyltransferase related protein